jgi:hypothetical protein
VHVNRHRVRPRRDTEHPDYWGLLVGQSVPDMHRWDRSVVVSVNLHEHEIVLAGINVHGGRSPHLLLSGQVFSLLEEGRTLIANLTAVLFLLLLLRGC